MPFTAFASRGRKHAVTARLIVRRVRDQNPDHLVADAQGELFPAWRHHAVFTDSPLVMLQAEADHRRHAIIEQVIADLKSGPLTHLPSGRFNANGAWLVLASMAFNLTRAAGALASLFHARATTATIRRQLINVPARPVRSARRIHLGPATDELALGRRLGRPVHRHPRATHRSRHLTTGPTATTTGNQWNGRADRQLSHARTPLTRHQDQQDSAAIRFGASGLEPR
jgi:hypothetical protein